MGGEGRGEGGGRRIVGEGGVGEGGGGMGGGGGDKMDREEWEEPSLINSSPAIANKHHGRKAW